MVDTRNWKDIVIYPQDPIAKDFEVRYKGKKILVRAIEVIFDLGKKDFVKGEENE